MGRTVYQKCVDMLKEFDGDEISLDGMHGLIMRSIGGCERTLKQAIYVMATTGLIQDIGNCKFKINRNGI